MNKRIIEVYALVDKLPDSAKFLCMRPIPFQPVEDDAQKAKRIIEGTEQQIPPQLFFGYIYEVSEGDFKKMMKDRTFEKSYSDKYNDLKKEFNLT